MYKHRVIIDGVWEEFDTLDEALEYLKRHWKDSTSIASIRKMYESGLMNFSVDRETKSSKQNVLNI